MRVCVVGSGLTSLTLAKALVNQSIDVDVLVNKKKQIVDSSRTIGMTKNNIEYFNKNIINIEEISWKLNKIEILTENLKREKLINFKNNKSHFFSIIKNYKLYERLRKSLSKNKNFRKISSNNYLSLSKKYDLVINTDNSNLITKKFFQKKTLKNYFSNAYTSIITHKKIHNTAAYQIFTQYGPLAFLPISNNQTSIVFSINNYKFINNEELSKLIKKYNFKYEIKKIEKFNSFSLKSINLRNYYHGNFLAFGDLLHKIHPLAGQGFNMTIRDLRVLTNIIVSKIELGLPMDQSICEEFEKKVKAKNMIFSKGIDLVHEFFKIESKLKSNILSNSIKIISNKPSLNKLFVEIADQGIIY